MDTRISESTAANADVPKWDKKPTLLTEKSLAGHLQVSVSALRAWRRKGLGPRFRKLGSLVRYRPEDVRDWLDAQPQGGETGIENEGSARRKQPARAGVNGESGAYFWVFKDCIIDACDLAVDLPVRETIAFAFEDQKDFKYRALQMYDRMKETNWPSPHRLGQIAFACKKQLVALQMADLTAYEFYKALHNKMYDPDRPLRKASARLKTKHPNAKYWTHDRILAVLRGSFE